jgi:hypothetical protein
MPYTETKLKSGKVKVTSPHGVKSKGSTPKNAERQVRLLNAIDHGFKPTGAPARDKLKHRVMKKY